MELYVSSEGPDPVLSISVQFSEGPFTLRGYARVPRSGTALKCDVNAQLVMNKH